MLYFEEEETDFFFFCIKILKIVINTHKNQIKKIHIFKNMTRIFYVPLVIDLRLR